MPVGQSQNHISAILNVMRGVDYAAFTPWLQLHTGDPGPSGTANISTVTDRRNPVFSAPSGTGMVAPAVSWAGWAGDDETITHVTLWDAATAGTFKVSGALAVPKLVEAGDTLNLTPTVAQGPLAS